MDKALYLGMSGAKQNMLSQRAHANNLANVNTTGFKKDFAQARSMPVLGNIILPVPMPWPSAQVPIYPLAR